MIIRTAEKSETVRQNLQRALAEHQTVHPSSFFEDLENQILFFQPVVLSQLFLFRDRQQILHRHSLKFSDIDLIAFRRSEGFGNRFFDLVGN